MKKNGFLVFLFLPFCFYACNNDADQKTVETKSENDIDAARNFINAALNGKYDEARSYMLQDSTNTQYFDAYERNFRRLGGEEKRNYRNATIKIYEVKPVSDSFTVVIYSNSYKNDRDTIKVLKLNNEWLVDFKYLFEHDMDSLYDNTRDTLK